MTILGFVLASCWGQVGILLALEAVLGRFWEGLGGDLGQSWNALGGVLRPGRADVCSPCRKRNPKGIPGEWKVDGN